MGALSRINGFRRRFMRSITKNIGKAQSEQNIVLVDKSEIKRVLICRPNARLGNLLLITPLVQEVSEMFPNCKVDLFVKGTLAPIVFQQYDSVENIIDLPKKPFKNIVQYAKVWISIKRRKYDMAINVDQNSSSGRLAVQSSNAKYKFFGDLAQGVQTVKEDAEHIAKYPVYNLRYYLAQLGFLQNDKKVKPLDLRLTSTEIANGKKILNELVPNAKKTICLFTYATGAKCLSETWWEDFYTQLKTEYKNYNIVEILPIENVSQIGFLAPTFYSKDIREMGSFLANVDLFIGADSGIMHLASAAQTPTIGLFSVSNLKKYEPYDNCSVGVDIHSYTKNDYFKTINAILNNGKDSVFSKAI